VTGLRVMQARTSVAMRPVRSRTRAARAAVPRNQNCRIQREQ
jgi:hypothetical protein